MYTDHNSLSLLPGQRRTHPLECNLAPPESVHRDNGITVMHLATMDQEGWVWVGGYSGGRTIL